MKMEILYVSILLIFGSLLLMFIFLILRRKIKTPELKIMGLLFAANAFYCFGYAFEMLANTMGDKLFFNHVQYLGLPFIAPLWLLMCLQFCRRWHKSSWKFVLPLLLVAVVTLVLNFTHTLNGLYYTSFMITQAGDISALVFTKGVWYYIETSARMTALSASLYLYAKELKRSDGLRKKQAAFLLLLSIIGLMLSASSVLASTTAVIDVACVLLSVPFVLILVTIYKHELFYLIPQAYSRLFDVLDQPILILSESWAVVKANPEAQRVFADSFKNKKPPLLPELFDGQEESDEPDRCLYRQARNGHLRYFSVKLISLDTKSTESGKGYLAVMADTTVQVEKIRSLRTLANGDPLTGLYNRRHFFATSNDKLSEAKTLGYPVSLLIFDIDHFKDINDACGHQAGDSVLRSVAGSISYQLRSGDVLARFGGDEFVLMLTAANTEDAESVAQRICAIVRNTEYLYDGRRIPVSISVGIGGGASSRFRDIDELMLLADKALYDAKSTGRDKVCVNAQCRQAG
jgi:diguanylate cyclase (GGDEF)-like protein